MCFSEVRGEKLGEMFDTAIPKGEWSCPRWEIFRAGICPEDFFVLSGLEIPQDE